MHLYNSLSQSIQSLTDDTIHMYVCGPTVYAPIHIGNARAFATYRLLARYLAWRGHTVVHSSNITDINEKIDRAAKLHGISSFEHAKIMERDFKEDTDRLGLGRPDLEPRASEYIDEMILMIQDMIQNGSAYVTDQGNVYFSVASFAGSGELSGRTTEDGISVRNLSGHDKENSADFALWKRSEHEPLWESPWGAGRPGWHLECSVMSEHTVGEHFHLHGGGRDLIFPHHEAERAQSLSVGHAHADLWWHTGMIEVNGVKGSKTAGNLPLLRDVIDEYSPQTFLLSLWSAQPRSNLEWTDMTLDMAHSRLMRWQNIWQRKKTGASDPVKVQMMLNTWQEIMDDDLNTAKALVYIEELFDMQSAESFLAIEQILDVLGLSLNSSDEAPTDIIELANERQIARETKQWATSDKIREKIRQAGWSIEDTPDGYRLIR